MAIEINHRTGTVSGPAGDLPIKHKTNYSDNYSDIMPWVGATGLGLISHSLTSSLIGEDDKKDSLWMKIVKKLIPLGAGVAGAYAGYELGKKADSDNTSDEKEDAIDLAAGRHLTSPWLYYAGGAASGAGSLASGYRALQWYRYLDALKAGRLDIAKEMSPKPLFFTPAKDEGIIRDLNAKMDEAASWDEQVKANRQLKQQWKNARKAYNEDISHKTKGTKAPVKPATSSPGKRPDLAPKVEAAKGVASKGARNWGIASGVLGAGVAVGTGIGLHNANAALETERSIKEMSERGYDPDSVKAVLDEQWDALPWYDKLLYSFKR